MDREFLKLLGTAMAAKDATKDLRAPDGTEYRVEANPAPRIRRRVAPKESSASGFQMTIWEPGPDRPVDFPPNTPFVPNVDVMTMRGTERAMEWTLFTPQGDLDEVVRDILEQGRLAGWTEGRRTDGMPNLPGLHNQHRGEMGRAVGSMAFFGLKMVLVIDMTRLEESQQAKTQP